MNSPATLPSMPSTGTQKLSGSRIVRKVRAFLELYATRKVLLGYLAFEIFIDVVFMFYWYFFHEVAFLSKWYAHWWLGHAISCLLRICAAGVGVYGVFTRKLQSVRLWFLLVMVSGLLMAISIVCVLRLRCWCDNFADCQALRAFSSSSQPMYIKETPPTGNLAWASVSPIHVSESPSRGGPETLETLFARHPEKEKEGSAAEGKMSLLERALANERAEEEEEEEGSGGGSSSNSEKTSDDDYDYDEDDAEEERLNRQYERARASARNVSSMLDVGRQEAAAQILAWFRTVAARSNADKLKHQIDTGLLDRFYAAPDGISWVPGIDSSRNNRPCNKFSLAHSPLAAFLLQSKLEEVRQVKWQRRSLKLDLGDPAVRKALEECFETSRCRSTSVFIDTEGEVKICKEIGNFRAIDSLPEAIEAVGEGERPKAEDLLLPFSISFRRKFVARRETKMSPLYELDLKAQTNPVEGMKLMKNVYTSTCTCDPDDNFNCQRETANYHSASYWCWVDQNTVRNCLENGIRIDFDKNKKKYWSSELCSATCSCSGLGMMPPKSESVPKEYVDKLDWGDSCRNWADTDGAESWCFVGFDSSCADRQLAGKYSEPGIEAMPLQYKSHLPCVDEQAQAEARDIARFRCSIGRVLVWSALLFQMMTRCVAVLLVHIFISKRCTDMVKVEEQFEVTFSDDDMSWDLGEEGSEDGKDDGKVVAGGKKEKGNEDDADDDDDDDNDQSKKK